MSTDRNRTDRHENAIDGWADCPQGELGNLARRLDARDRRRRNAATAKTAGAVTLGMALLVVGVGLVRGPIQAPAAAIGCGECMASFEAVHQHLTDPQDQAPASFQPAWSHLAVCQKCQRQFEAEHPGLLKQHGMTILLSLATGATFSSVWFTLLT